jgi:Na+-transporting NADH:ubiquinone oxidoreductase subunit NqrB
MTMTAMKSATQEGTVGSLVTMITVILVLFPTVINTFRNSENQIFVPPVPVQSKVYGS